MIYMDKSEHCQRSKYIQTVADLLNIFFKKYKKEYYYIVALRYVTIIWHLCNPFRIFENHYDIGMTLEWNGNKINWQEMRCHDKTCQDMTENDRRWHGMTESWFEHERPYFHMQYFTWGIKKYKNFTLLDQACNL